jgi:chromosome segregation ATPase
MCSDLERVEGELNQGESAERQLRALYLQTRNELHEVQDSVAQLEQEKRDGILALEHIEEKLSNALEHMQSTIHDRENRILAMQLEMKSWRETYAFQYNASTFPYTTAEIRDFPHNQHQANLLIESLASQVNACSSVLERAESGVQTLSARVQALQADKAESAEAIHALKSSSAVEAQLLEDLSPVPTRLCATLKDVCKGLVAQCAQQKRDARTGEQLQKMMACLEMSPQATPSKGVARIRGMQVELASARSELDRSRAQFQDSVSQRQALGGELLRLRGLLDHVHGEFELVRQDLVCRGEVEGGLELRRREMEEGAEAAGRMLNLSEAHVRAFEGKLREVELQCEANQQRMQQMGRFVDELGATLDQEHVRVWECQLDAERADTQRAEAERRLEALQAHYGDACQELLKERGSRDSRAAASGSKASLFSHADTVAGFGLNFFGSHNNHPASLAADGAGRRGPGPLVSDPLGSGHPACGGAAPAPAEDRLIAERAELEWKVGSLQEELDRARADAAALRAGCARLEGELAAAREELEERAEDVEGLRRQVKEERLLAVEDRQRLMEELRETKSRQKQLVAAAQVGCRPFPRARSCEHEHARTHFLG